MNLRTFVAHTYCIFLLSVVVYFSIAKDLSLFGVDGDRLWCVDFAMYMKMGESLLFEGINIYSDQGRLEVLHQLTGQQNQTILSVAIPPMGYWVWIPIIALARSNLNLAYSVWLSISFYICLRGAWALVSALHSNRRHLIFCVLLILVAMSSTTVFWGFLIGQTSMAMSGILMLISAQALNKKWSVVSVTAAILLGFLKQPYLLIVLSLLCALNVPKAVLLKSLPIPVAIGLSATIFYLPFLSDYGANVDKLIAPLSNAMQHSGYFPETMSLFRTAGSVFIGEDLSRRISLWACSIGLVLSIVAIVVTRCKNTGETAIRAWCNSVGSYLLFAPYAGEYENTLLLSVVTTYVLFSISRVSQGIQILVATFIVLNHAAYSTMDTMWTVWISKLYIFLVINSTDFTSGLSPNLGAGAECSIKHPRK